MALRFILVQDTCFGVWVWDHLKADLEASKKSVTLVHLPEPNSHVVCDDYSQPLLDALGNLRDGDMAVVVAHGMGGITAAIAMDTYPDKIAITIFVNAFMPDTANQPSFVIDQYLEKFKIDWKDTETQKHPCSDGYLETMKLGPEFLKSQMYNLSPNKDLEEAKIWTICGSLFLESLRRRAKFTNQGYGAVARAYIASAEDQRMHLNFHKWQVDNYELNDPKDFHQVRDADHIMMISRHSRLS